MEADAFLRRVELRHDGSYQKYTACDCVLAVSLWITAVKRSILFLPLAREDFFWWSDAR